MLTNYNFENGDLQRERFSNFLLTPLVTALGSEVSFKGNSWDNLTIDQNKTAHIATRVFAGVAGLLLFPMTLLGLATRKLSSIHYNNQELAAKLIAKDELRRLAQTTMEAPANTRKEKLQKAIQLGHIIDGNATHEVNKDQQKELVLEIKKLLEEEVRSSADGFIIWPMHDCPSRESFSADVDYNDCLNLKRVLYRLTYHESKNEFKEMETTSFEECYKQVRSAYYEKFSVEHMMHNLRTKREVTSIQFKIDNLTEETLNEIQSVYQESLRPNQVNWLHGTQFPTLVAMATTDCQLKPSGMLRQEGQVIYCGENNEGWNGINQECISGTSLDCFGLKIALDYAQGIGVGVSDEKAMECRAAPERLLNAFVKNFEEFIQQLENNRNCPELDSYKLNSATYMHNLRRYLSILASLRPELYKEKMIPTIQRLIEASRYKVRGTIIEDVFMPALTFEKLSKHSPEERALLQKSYLMIFGSTNIQLLIPGQEIKSPKYAFYMGGQTNEVPYRGALKMGTDLQFIFVLQKNIEETRRYLAQKNISDVRVTNIEALKIAEQYKVFKDKKSHHDFTNYANRPLKPMD